MQLGITVRDVITGFQGTVIGYVEYLTGCNQALVQAVGRPDKGDCVTKRPDAEWFDVQRLKRIGLKVVVLDNGVTPGCDREAPKR